MPKLADRVLVAEQKAYMAEGLPFRAVRHDDRNDVLEVVNRVLHALDDQGHAC